MDGTHVTRIGGAPKGHPFQGLQHGIGAIIIFNKTPPVGADRSGFQQLGDLLDPVLIYAAERDRVRVLQRHQPRQAGGRQHHAGLLQLPRLWCAAPSMRALIWRPPRYASSP